LKGTVGDMDNFMDKLAQKFNAQELIKANTEADTNEMKRLKVQISEYEKILQEMRKLNYKNTEMSEKLEIMIGENADKLQAIKDDEQTLVSKLHDITDEQTRNMESENAKKENTNDIVKELEEFMEGKFQNSDDFVHKENVKVYRNVQAVVIDELKRYTDLLLEENKSLRKKINAVMCIGVIAAVASICNIIIWVTIMLISSGII
jgi:hypothetical protein